MAAPVPREWDLVIYGATGDAGTAIAFYLANNCSLRWAIAGRTERDLLRLRSRIIVGRDKPSVEPIGVIVADSSEGEHGESVESMARSARMVLSAVGPYTTLGEGTVAACVRQGTLYADITGEVDWVSAMREKYQERATRSGSTLCSFAGYDCVPMELSVHLALRALASKKLTNVECVMELVGGAMPRGTIRTTISKLPGAFSFGRNLVRYAPPNQRLRTLQSLFLWILPRYSRRHGTFTVPHFMGLCNVPVIHNSFAGRIDIYHDRMVPPHGNKWWTGYGAAQTLAFYYVLLLGAPFLACLQLLFVAVPPAARALLRLFDAQSYRANPARQAGATVEVTTYAAAAAGGRAVVRFFCRGDAGIRCTSLLAAETALAMLDADDRGELPRGIFGSPAMICGDALVGRLQAEGGDCTLTVSVVGSNKED